MKILPVVAELFQTDGRTDMTKLLVTFHNFTKAHENILDKNCIEFKTQFYVQ